MDWKNLSKIFYKLPLRKKRAGHPNSCFSRMKKLLALALNCSLWNLHPNNKDSIYLPCLFRNILWKNLKCFVESARKTSNKNVSKLQNWIRFPKIAVTGFFNWTMPSCPLFHTCHCRNRNKQMHFVIRKSGHLKETSFWRLRFIHIISKRKKKRFYALCKRCVDAGSNKIDCMLCYSEGCRGNEPFASISEWPKDLKAWKCIAAFWTNNFLKLLKCSHWVQISQCVSVVLLHEVRCFLRYSCFPNASPPVLPTYTFFYKRKLPSYQKLCRVIFSFIEWHAFRSSTKQKNTKQSFR